MKISVTAVDGREVILDVLGEGARVGELSAVDGHLTKDEFDFTVANSVAARGNR